MRTIKEVLHEKRKATEDHIKGLQRQGKQGVRYTAMMSDIPFLVLGLMSDIGWIVHLIAGARYFRRNGFHHVLDYMALISLTAVLFGVAYLIYLNKIQEKEIVTKIQKELGFGVTAYSGLAGAIIGILQIGDYRMFISACVDGYRRLPELCFGFANLPLIQKGNFLRSKITG